ncbi:hypothetical protein A0H81_14385 [Grifola frondosa]|uniref:Uncharacterized protein n=1 Tax=Grifola frondosa TaxID=5627 RepID=A0A1C7LLY2_GRIFR|nr:hypothetical protein A0H81_14385 [Grifola frondosa]
MASENIPRTAGITSSREKIGLKLIAFEETQPALQDKTKALEKKINELQAKLDEEKALHKAAQEPVITKDYHPANVAYKFNHLPHKDRIVKPQTGKGFSLIAAMCLSDRRNIYKTLQRDVGSTSRTGLDEGLQKLGPGGPWTSVQSCEYVCVSAQGPDLPCVLQARDMHLFLSQFLGDWATAEIVMQWMRNKCKHAVRMGYIPKREERIAAEKEGGDINPDHIMDDEDPFARYFETEDPEEEDEMVDADADRE